MPYWLIFILGCLVAFICGFITVCAMVDGWKTKPSRWTVFGIGVVVGGALVWLVK